MLKKQRNASRTRFKLSASNFPGYQRRGPARRLSKARAVLRALGVRTVNAAPAWPDDGLTPQALQLAACDFRPLAGAIQLQVALPVMHGRQGFPHPFAQ